MRLVIYEEKRVGEGNGREEEDQEKERERSKKRETDRTEKDRVGERHTQESLSRSLHFLLNLLEETIFENKR